MGVWYQVGGDVSTLPVDEDGGDDLAVEADPERDQADCEDGEHPNGVAVHPPLNPPEGRGVLNRGSEGQEGHGRDDAEGFVLHGCIVPGFVVCVKGRERGTGNVPAPLRS